MKYFPAFVFLTTAAICALAAWFFWSYFQHDGFDILYIVTIVVLMVQNHRLRTALNRRRPAD